MFLDEFDQIFFRYVSWERNSFVAAGQNAMVGCTTIREGGGGQLCHCYARSIRDVKMWDADEGS